MLGEIQFEFQRDPVQQVAQSDTLDKCYVHQTTAQYTPSETNVHKESVALFLLASFRNSKLHNLDTHVLCVCLLYTSDAADDTPCVDLGGRRIIKKKKKRQTATNEEQNED
eukprot:TRINITY_DN3482_c0_g2_i3.p3 TRINITY_DN3482_c0_g2~~TRINITY_DN3482_c0_g2_i3.p3  ORF type:complete len:111 (+),score=7.71 TRINITY_DN3482_c0_g2_i3:225-557(+)